MQTYFGEKMDADIFTRKKNSERHVVFWQDKPISGGDVITHADTVVNTCDVWFCGPVET